MILQQLRYLRAIIENGFNISRAAEALHTSQPGISKQVRLLEQELRIDIFIRDRGRILGLTEPGRAIAQAADAALLATQNIGSVASDFLEDEVGSLRIAATFTVAKYLLPPTFLQFVRRYPRVALSLHEGDPSSACRMVSAAEADIAVCTRPSGRYPDLLLSECRKLSQVLIAPKGHPLLFDTNPGLADIARYPFITFNAGSLGQTRIQQKFEENGHPVKAVFSSSMNADVVKSLVAEGLGVAILSRIVYDPVRDPELGCIDLDHLLEPRSVCFAIRADLHPRAFVLSFIRMLVPGFDVRSMPQALSGAAPYAGVWQPVR